ncbi:Serine/threonine-protein kinase TNNI3K [Tetrabaena socialis]|uniref:Serine/threonine-protein kinase TNNI3K n=1 Tax=Tetrabaena socialis TaxID=47790 RepID=A0A2J8AF58_9CHLO|nr:Serine/threonine-protein kinase TNNI3K [Tetrabaena socialis]|eukprot:PNH11158.1 Serine/threonine-protein kinase TNNI3K [Tetrabaena socialis]
MMRASRSTTPAGAAAVSSTPAQVVLSYRVPETGAVELGGNGMVLRMQERLQHAGYSVFVGEASLQAGDSWDDMIQGAVERCSVFVALCSPTCAMSTPLHIASLNGHVDTAKTLLQAGADVLAKTKDGYSPLHIASWKGHSHVAVVLLAAGADACVEQKVGLTPMRHAKINDHYGVYNLLREAGEPYGVVR